MTYRRLTILCLFCCIIPWLQIGAADAQVNDSDRATKNSTRKIRVKLNEMSSLIGTAIKWRADVDQAVAESRTTGRPVFWYIPTVPGSFMDRKSEIDRYMLAGPFSWPLIIETLNEEFIPVRGQPDKQQQERYGLVRYKFVEPGFIVLDGEAEKKLSDDRITTMHPDWIQALLAKASGKPVQPQQKNKELAAAWAQIRSGNWQFEPAFVDGDDDSAIEQILVTGMLKFRQGKHDEAKTIWRSAAAKDREHPLTWKAEAEAQGIGPFVRGFEVVRQVPEICLQAGINSSGSAAPKNAFDEPTIWRRSLDFLLGMQNESGGYVDCDYDFGGTDSLPNVHVAVTSLVGMALLEAKSNAPGYRSDEIDRAIRGCQRFVTDPKNINAFDRDEILWAYAYRLRFLSRLQVAGFDVDSLLADAVKPLENIQSRRGRWYHEYENPFVTATALGALHEAKRAGAEIDSKKVESGIRALANDRSSNGSYPYYGRQENGDKKRQASIDQIKAAAGRMPVCELSLRYWGESSEQRLNAAIKSSFEFHDNLHVALKYDDHTNRFSYGGFFFWYDMRGRSEAIAALSDPQSKREFMQQQKDIVLSLVELDGCFVDSHELGRCYGTAMALLCLARANQQQAFLIDNND